LRQNYFFQELLKSVNFSSSCDR